MAHYLKALGLLRLVSEQADGQARGSWQDDQFVLLTTLDASALEAFLVDEYRPTPLIAPWNGGSGFYPKDNTSGVDALASSTHPRFERYRDAIAWARTATDGLEARPDKQAKVDFVKRCRQEWPEDRLVWLDAALALLGPDVKYPALLGTGGNDGRLDFTNNFMQRLMALFGDDGASPHNTLAWLRAALYGTPATDLPKAVVGQFLPGAAGGMNAGPGFTGTAQVNPWDFVLMLEGALAFQVGVVRQLESNQLPQAAAPFAFRARAAGYGSATRSEESARGEQWMPLWDRPCTWTELRAVLCEGRMQQGGARAQEPVDAAKAIAAHGTARGITAFERYSYIERNGQSNLAVPVGRWTVSPNQAPNLLHDLGDWVDRLRRATSDNAIPVSMKRLVRRIEDAQMALLADPKPLRVQDLLLRLGEADHALISRPRFVKDHHLNPLMGLDDDWITQGATDASEWRLALAFAAQQAVHQPATPGAPRTREIRGHFRPQGDSHWRFAMGPNGLREDPGVCWTGRDLVSDLCAIVERRLVETKRLGLDGLCLRPGYRLHASLDDIQRFVRGETDDARLSGLIRGLIGLLPKRHEVETLPSQPVEIHAGHALLRCVFPGREVQHDQADRPLRLQPGRDPQTIQRLLAGDPSRAAAVAARRLTANGLRPRLDRLVASTAECRRWVAALLFPTSNRDLVRLADSITYTSQS